MDSRRPRGRPSFHLALYLTAVFLVLTPLQAVVFIVVHQGLFGVYLGSSFAPSHKGMPTLAEDNDLDYLRRQVRPHATCAASPPT